MILAAETSPRPPVTLRMRLLPRSLNEAQLGYLADPVIYGEIKEWTLFSESPECD